MASYKGRILNFYYKCPLYRNSLGEIESIVNEIVKYVIVRYCE